LYKWLSFIPRGVTFFEWCSAHGLIISGSGYNVKTTSATAGATYAVITIEYTIT
jgi:hypothetical protein